MSPALELSPKDRETALTTYRAERASRGPANLSPLGGLLFLGSLGLFMTLPRVAAALGLGDAARGLLFALVVVGLFAGLALLFFFGPVRRQRYARTRAGEASDRLAAAAGLERPELIAAAARLVANARLPRGAWVVTTIDIDGVRDRLGPVLPLAETVERLLVRDAQAYPVLTEQERFPV